MYNSPARVCVYSLEKELLTCSPDHYNHPITPKIVLILLLIAKIFKILKIFCQKICKTAKNVGIFAENIDCISYSVVRVFSGCCRKMVP